MLRGGTGAANPPGSMAKQGPQCQHVVQDRVKASVSICPKHPTPGDIRGYAASLTPCLTMTGVAVLLGVHVPLAFTNNDVI